MIIVRVIHTVFFYVLTVISFFIGTTLTLILLPFCKSKTKAFQTAAHIWAKFLIFSSGLSAQTQGIENIPKDKTLIFAANHQGAADILIVLGCLPIGFRFAIKKELYQTPVFGWYLRQAGYFSVDREVVLSAYRTVKQIIEILKIGESVLIFPEGTRSKTGKLGKFRRGSLLAALKSGAPIVPVAISGSFNLMPRGTWIIHPCPVKFSVGKPIYINSKEDYDNKVLEVRDSIAKMM
ncbi:MAG: 1-acyl-sn-glycerol-3-phosphate acyltransferase [Candidatus Saganbacteria bacterium]|nr:1-acyl-sn-glycerol-3-phosphate acyltransferase [Candidatus Saganbacteria bacterium]